MKKQNCNTIVTTHIVLGKESSYIFQRVKYYRRCEYCARIIAMLARAREARSITYDVIDLCETWTECVP